MWNFPVLIYLCLFALMDFFFCHMFLRDCSPRLSIYLKSVTYQQIQWSKVLVLEMIPVNVLALLLVVFDVVYSIALMNFICTFQPFCCLSLSPIMLDWVEIFNCLYLHVSRGCVENCQETGCVGSQQCFQHCIFTADGNISDGRWYLQEPLYLKWKQWDCHSDCRYYCMLAREEERRKLGEKPVKYHGRWPFRRVYGIQVLMCSCLLQYVRLFCSSINFICPSISKFKYFRLVSPGTCFCFFFCTQSCYTISWLDIFLHSCQLQAAFDG